MRNNKIYLILLVTLLVTLSSNSQVFADVDSYIIQDNKSNKFYQYFMDDILESYKQYMRNGESDGVYLEFSEKMESDKNILAHDNLGKYIDYNIVLENYQNAKRNNKEFNLNDFCNQADAEEKPKYVFDRIKKDKKIFNRLNITGDNVEKDLSSDEFKECKDIIITGSNVVIKSCHNADTLSIKSDPNSPVIIKDSKFKEIKFSSGKTMKLDGVIADNLIVDSEKEGNIQCENKAYIKNTCIKSNAKLSLLSGSYGKVTIAIEENKNGKVKLEGSFIEPIIIESSVILQAEKSNLIKQVYISPKSKNNNIILDGNFNSVNINRQAKLDVVSGSINQMITNADASINVGKNAKVKAIYNKGHKVTKTGEGKVEKELNEKEKEDNSSEKSSHSSSHSSSSSSGGETKPTTVSVESINFKEEIVNMEIGQEIELKPIITPENATNKKLIWSIENQGIVEMHNGIIRALKEGEAIISVSTVDGNKTASFKVVVVKEKVVEVDTLSLDKQNIDMILGQKAKLTAIVNPQNAETKFLWSSNNEKVVTVDDGIITALSPGTAVITVKCAYRKSATCKVTVRKDVVSVENIILKDKIEVLENEKIRLHAEIRPENALNKGIIWKSDNKEIAIVKYGTVTGIKEGTTNIIAESKDGKIQAKCRVTVRKFNAVVSTENNFVNFSIEDIFAKGKVVTMKMFNKTNGRLEYVDQKNSDTEEKQIDRFNAYLGFGKYYAEIKVNGLDKVIAKDFEVKMSDSLKELIGTIKKGYIEYAESKKLLEDNKKFKIQLKDLWDECSRESEKLNYGLTTASAIMINSDSTTCSVIQVTTSSGIEVTTSGAIKVTSPSAITVNYGVDDKQIEKQLNELTKILERFRKVKERFEEEIRKSKR